ncbi:NAD(P)-dependent oxidoreductase [Staphylococcus aureus]
MHGKARVFYLLSGKDVFNSTIGIYGMGDIGKAFARRFKGLILIFLIIIDQDIKMQRRLNATYVSFETLLAESDFIVLVQRHLQKKHIINLMLKHLNK